MSIPTRCSKLFNNLLGTLLVIALLFFCYLMLGITIPYLIPPFHTDIEFLATKQHVIDLLYWKTAFYIHISSSFFVLLAGATQFSPFLMRCYPRIHRNIGKIYVFLILGISAPSGFVMALYANGGTPTIIAFILQAILWWTFTFLAYRTIRQKNVQAHAKWMFRSYALTLSAVTLRIISFLVGWLMLPIPYTDLYLISAWGSWSFNLLLAETLLFFGAMKYYFKS